MNQYETVFILDPMLSQEGTKDKVAKFKQLIQDDSGEIINQEEWGVKKMAYSIKYKTSGFYLLMEFKADPVFIKKLDLAFRRDEQVIRHLIIKLDKNSIAYSEKRRNAKNSDDQN